MISAEEEYSIVKSMQGKCIGEISLALTEAQRVAVRRDTKYELCKFQIDLLICNNLILEIRKEDG